MEWSGKGGEGVGKGGEGLHNNKPKKGLLLQVYL